MRNLFPKKRLIPYPTITTPADNGGPSAMDKPEIESTFAAWKAVRDTGNFDDSVAKRFEDTTNAAHDRADKRREQRKSIRRRWAGNGAAVA